jgi:stress response protein SCP2
LQKIISYVTRLFLFALKPIDIYIFFKARGKNDEFLKLKDYHVQPNSTIYLLVLLYEVPDRFDHVIFDLFWGYPDRFFGFLGKHFRRDYLDASVLLYSDSQFIEVVDYNHRASRSRAVKHSGDVMDDEKRLGHHTIKVSIKSLPAHINKLVFTLSAWNSPNISKYPNPSLRFFDAMSPDTQLCSDEMSGAVHSQAIIMCCLTNRGSGWQVFSLKHLSDGNSENYEPLKNSIVDLIGKGYI